MPPSPTTTSTVEEPKKVKPTKKKKVAADPTTEEQPPPPAVESDSVQPTIKRPIIYPVVRCEICSGENALTVDHAKAYLAWETEAEHMLRLSQENPGVKDSDTYEMPDGSITTFGNAKKYGDAFMLIDEDKAKVRCWSNLNNRDFDRNWCMALAQSILNGQWAGEITVPGTIEGEWGLDDPYVAPDGTTYNKGDKIIVRAGSINGSSINISYTGRVESGQHSLIAEILAHQMWWKNRKAYPFWLDSTTGPVIETSVFTGLSEDPRVIMTVDTIKPRSEADVFYTSDIQITMANGKKVAFKDLDGSDRKELSRMLQAEVDLAWKRFGTLGYKTHAEAVAFVDRHPKLLKCLEHLFVENSSKSGRKVSNLRLSAGGCAALCYLMGCSGPKTDGDLYRNGFPPSEKGLDWSLLTKAKDFFAMIGAHPDLQAVRVALAELQDGDPDSTDEMKAGLGGRVNERLAIISKAWAIYKEGHLPTADDVTLTYDPAATITGEDGVEKTIPVSLNDLADFGGIDIPQPTKKAAAGSTGGSAGEAPMTTAQLEEEKEKARWQKAEEAAAKVKAMKMGADGKPASVKPTTGPTAAGAPAVATTNKK